MSSSVKAALLTLANGIPLNPLPPPVTHLDPSVAHAPKRNPTFRNKNDYILAIRNALRYFPSKYHSTLLPEFESELNSFGHIYMYRFRPIHYEMKGYPISLYPGKLTIAKCIMIMIMNNLDYDIAQFPHELITYGGNGSVLSNWAQYHLLMKYLCQLSDEQTLVMMSGHPLGIFPSTRNGPRLVISNGMVIPNYSSKSDYSRMYALGVTIYGQMTAGSYCYIGPQGIVHGTTITLLNAGRKYLGLETLNKSGIVYVSSGLGGMSGAQPKATYIIGCIGVFAEVDIRAINKRYQQGWVQEIIEDLDVLINRIIELKSKKESRSIAYHGNIVDLWCKLAEYTQQTGRLLCELGSDQTSLHNPFAGGYYPYQISFKQSQELMTSSPNKFKDLVQKSLVRHVSAINILNKYGMKFWDYGNCFLLESARAGANIMKENDKYKFKYPSYVEDIMGDIFSLGFGPFRWICTSRDPNDLIKTDKIAENVLCELRSNECEDRVLQQLNDNIYWIRNANANKLVVGTQARILYANADARIGIAIKMNNAIARGDIGGAIVLSRDHHDVSGTDSPFRETSNINDGSKYCADMAVHNFVGDSFRGASWVALHNGGGVGFGEVINGGFGLVLDGSKQAEINCKNMLFWDVNNGIARRAWSGNNNANFQIKRAMKNNKKLSVTLRNDVDNKLIEKINIPSKL